MTKILLEVLKGKAKTSMDNKNNKRGRNYTKMKFSKTKQSSGDFG